MTCLQIALLILFVACTATLVIPITVYLIVKLAVLASMNAKKQAAQRGGKE